MNEIWNIWPKDVHYGDVLFKRAIGEYPEMESSKALAKLLKKRIKPRDRVLDVGCGAGHYLTSLKREIPTPFSYTGVDSTQNYIDLAKKAFEGQADVEFIQSDIFNLSMGDASFDIVTCNNVLLHLPSIQKPVAELLRVTRSTLVIRTLIGNRSFRIKDVEVSGDEFYPEGEPRQYHYYNIYSQAYFKHLLAGHPKVRGYEFIEDWDYDPAVIEQAGAEHEGMMDTTDVLGKWQRNGYILQPWTFLVVEVS